MCKSACDASTHILRMIIVIRNDGICIPGSPRSHGSLKNSQDLGSEMACRGPHINVDASVVLKCGTVNCGCG